MSKYLRNFGGWQIYEVPEAYQMSNGQLITRYIAVNTISKQCVDDVNLASLEAQICEAER